MKISTEQLIDQLELEQPYGFQISLRHGFINSTKVIYLKKAKVFLFATEDDFSFSDNNGYTKDEFLDEYKGYP